MKITALAENTAERADLKTVHGLSIFIETRNHKILFDLGPEDVIFGNAEKLGIDLMEIDTVVISHGHDDHGGALKQFLAFNDKAKVYIRKQAFDPYYVDVKGDKKYIGLDAELADNERIVFTEGARCIDDELFVFSNVLFKAPNTVPLPNTKSGSKLLKKGPEGFVQDDFGHEQNMILTAEDKAVLFTGCAHSGIGGIMPEALRYQGGIEAVFGGFHLYNPNSGETEPEGLVRGLAETLSAYDAVFYTCHCTGQKAFDIMREIMGEKLRHLATGTTVDI